MGAYYKYAENGKHFVLTLKGYTRTKEDIKPERAVGKPVNGFEDRVPVSWLVNGYVEEVTK